MALSLSSFLLKTGPQSVPGEDAPISTRLDTGMYLDWQGINKALGKSLIVNKGNTTNPNFVVDGSGIGNSYGQLQALLDPYINPPAPPAPVPAPAPASNVGEGLTRVNTPLVSSTAASVPNTPAYSHIWGDVDIDQVNKLLASKGDWQVFSPNDITAEQRTPGSREFPSGASYALFRKTNLGWDNAYTFADPSQLKDYLANPSGMALPSSNYLADRSNGNPVEANPGLLLEDLVQNKGNDAMLRELPGYGTQWGLGWNDGTVEGITQWLANGARDIKGGASSPEIVQQAKDSITYQLKQQALDKAKTSSIQTALDQTPASNASPYGKVFKTAQPYDYKYLAGTDPTYYMPGGAGYNVYGNSPGFYYNPKTGSYVASSGYGMFQGDAPKDLFSDGQSLSNMYWVPWQVAPQELRDSYGNDPKNIQYKSTGTAPGTLTAGKLDTDKLDPSKNPTLPLDANGNVDMDAVLKDYGDKGLFGTGLDAWDIVNGGLGTALGKITGTGKPTDPTIIDTLLPGSMNPGPSGPFANPNPSGRTDYGSEIPKPKTGIDWIDEIINRLPGKRVGQPGGQGGTAGGGAAGNTGGQIGGQGPGGPGNVPPTTGPGGVTPDQILGATKLGDYNVSGDLTSLDQILREYFLPEFQRLQGGIAGTESELLDATRKPIDESGREALLTQALGAKPDLEKYARDYMSGAESGKPNFAAREKAIMDAIGAPTDFSRIREELTTIAGGVAGELFAPGGQFDTATQGALQDSVDSGFGASSGGFTRARENILAGGRDVVSRSIAQNAAALAPLALEERGQNINALLQNESILSPLEADLYGKNLAARGDVFKTLAGGALDEYTTGVNARASQLSTMAQADVAGRGQTLSTLSDFLRTQRGSLEDLRSSLFTGQSTVEQLKLAREQQELNKQLINKALASNKTDWLGGIKDFAGTAIGLAFAGKTLKDLFS